MVYNWKLVPVQSYSPFVEENVDCCMHVLQYLHEGMITGT